VNIDFKKRHPTRLGCNGLFVSFLGYMMDEVSALLVCELPDGLVLSDSDWKLVFDHWVAGDRKFLDASEVHELISRADDRNDRVR
jgi:hypothetical protein